MQDQQGRGYLRVSPDDAYRLSLAAGHQWWWCVLPLRRSRSTHFGAPPRIGAIVGRYMVQRTVLGFARGRTVGVVELR